MLKSTHYRYTTYRALHMLVLSLLLLGCGSGGGDRAGLGNSGKFNVSGSVSGVTQQGVIIALTGKTTATATTDANGNYSFPGLANGSYTITPVKSGFIFNPSSTAITVSGADVSDTKFVATGNSASTSAVSGTVIGAVTENVLITLSGQGNATTRTNVGGNYSFTGLLNGNYTAAPSLDGFSFSPTTAQATINNANATFSNFISTQAQAATFSISGTVSGDTKQGVTVSLNGTSVTASTTTDAAGVYSFTGLANGNYTISTVKTGFTFNPNSTTVTVKSLSIKGIDFTATTSVAPTYTASGTVTGGVTNGVTITLSGSANGTTTTNVSGNYSFSGLANGSYTATPTLTGYTFSPASVQVAVNNANATFGNINAVEPTYSIAGSVSGATASGVTINLTGGATKSTTTDASGNYSFSGIANGNYTVTPVKTGYTFNPPSVTLSINYGKYNGPYFTSTAINKLLGGTIQGTPLNLTTVVSTLAGSGTTGAIDGTGIAASFYGPFGVTTDGTNLYVADYSNNKIRKIVIATGDVTTLAGSGTAGASDGTGLAASFNGPTGVNTDGTNLYVTDYFNHKIRKIVISSGAVTTLAGSGTAGATDGTGSAATFNQPTYLITDGTNLYVADQYNNKIRKIVIATARVTTLAGGDKAGFSDGNGIAALFNQPQGITVDGNNLYIADFGNNRIRKVVISTGAVSTLAGGAKSGYADGGGTAAMFNGPVGLTTDGTNLYVTDNSNHQIRNILISSKVVTTLAGGPGGGFAEGADATALFQSPAGIISDGKCLYVTDRLNHRIRKIQ